MRRLLLGLLAFVSACASAGPSYSPIYPRLSVRNQNFLRAIVYADYQGALFRIGDVEAISELETPLRIPTGASIRFVIRLFPSFEMWASDALVVYSGEKYELNVAGTLSMSTYSWVSK